MCDLETAFERSNWSGLVAILSTEDARASLQARGMLAVALRLPEALARKKVVQAARVFNRISLKDLCGRFFADTTYSAADIVRFLEAVSNDPAGSITATLDQNAGGIVTFQRRTASPQESAGNLQQCFDACVRAQQQHKAARARILQHPEYIRRRQAQQHGLAPGQGVLKGQPSMPGGYGDASMMDLDVEGESDGEMNA